MLGSSIMTSSNAADSRTFVYEVEGLRQNDQTDQAAFAIRKSSTVLFPVPLGRMNTFMQRIGSMGGKIVAIHDSWDAAKQSASPEESDSGSSDDS